MAEGRHLELVESLRRLAEGAAERSGLEVVELSLRGPSRRRLLRVDIDRAGPQGVNLDDCRRFSLEIGQLLDESGLIPGQYSIEISSPGVDRPIRSADDIRRNVGRRVVVNTVEPVHGRRCVRGVLVSGDESEMVLSEGGGDVLHIPLELVEKARQDVSF